MLKSLDDVLTADERFRNLVVGTPSAGIRFMTLADHHSYIAAIDLIPAAPPHVREAFERARNTFLYSWFVYDLTPLAQSQGYAALEMALRARLGAKPNGKRWKGMTELVGEARSRGLLGTFPLPPHVQEPSRDEYLSHLATVIRVFRNDLAHGSSYLNMPGATLDALQECADLINHLFRP